ncbi:class I histocompatibility antigen, F10 alpha chain-like isoform X3 [Paralichthys olivaceus]|uniref:class I histocompatibility antigen, F10 alpha chain-like isoform X3 n=1 Tax=Paralichthys olivaceus TaxID=8255 RepID=UPI0037526A25
MMSPPLCVSSRLVVFCLCSHSPSLCGQKTSSTFSPAKRNIPPLTMHTLLFLLLLAGTHSATARTHSLNYMYTASSQVPNFPEFVVVGYVDEVQMIHYDSNTKKAVPKQDWMLKATDSQYWESLTQKYFGHQQIYKNNIEIAKERFNQTEGIHIMQWMYGCEWDDETGEVKGYDQHGYDGEDFISFDQQTETYIAPTPQAVITKLKWENDKAELAYYNNFYTQECPSWLKKFLEHGKSSLQRTELPWMSLLQKSPSSPVSCHATGFYPDIAMLFWRKDGEELHEDVYVGEVLPNHDGTFQMSTDLQVSSIPPEDWRRYDCVFQISGVKEDIVKRLDKDSVESNREKPTDVTTIIIIAAVVGVVLAVIGFIVYRKRNVKCLLCPGNDPNVLNPLNPDGPVSNPPSETSS